MQSTAADAPPARRPLCRWWRTLTLYPSSPAQVVLFLLASHGTDFGRQPLGLNLLVLLVLVIAKLPALHKVRILGINKY